MNKLFDARVSYAMSYISALGNLLLAIVVAASASCLADWWLAIGCSFVSGASFPWFLRELFVNG